MSSDQSTVDFLTEQFAGAGRVSSRKMFGDYALYCNDKVFAFVCDDQLYIKPIDAARNFIKTPIEKPAYPGSKMYFWITPDKWDDDVWLVSLLKAMLPTLPAKKKK